MDIGVRVKKVKVHRQKTTNILRDLGLTPLEAMMWFLIEKMRFSYSDVTAHFHISRAWAHRLVNSAKKKLRERL